MSLFCCRMEGNISLENITFRRGRVRRKVSICPAKISHNDETLSREIPETQEVGIWLPFAFFSLSLLLTFFSTGVSVVEVVFRPCPKNGAPKSHTLKPYLKAHMRGSIVRWFRSANLGTELLDLRNIKGTFNLLANGNQRWLRRPKKELSASSTQILWTALLGLATKGGTQKVEHNRWYKKGGKYNLPGWQWMLWVFFSYRVA